MKKVLVLGGTSLDEIIHLDLLPDPVSQTIFASAIETVGSTGAGKAWSMTRLGIPVRLHTILADDEAGHKIIDGLLNEGIDFVYDIDVRTERHVNLMDKDGNRISIFTAISTSDLRLDTERLESMIRKADLVVLNILAYEKPLIPLLHKYRKEVWTDLQDYRLGDPYYDPFIEASQVVFLSTDRSPEYGTQMQKWIKDGKRIVVATHGQRGSTMLEPKKEPRFEPAISSFRLIDANGAGDSYFAGFLYGYLQGAPLQKCQRLGTIAGGLAVTSKRLVAEELSSAYLESMHHKIYEEEVSK